MFNLLTRITIAGLLVAFSTSCLTGQSTSWTGNGSTNDFFEAANWSSGIPEPEQSIQFSLPTTYSVKLTAAAEGNFMNAFNGQLTLLGGGELNVNQVFILGGEFTIDEPQTRLRSDGDVLVGSGNSGALLRIVGGGEFSALGNLSYRNDSSIEVTGGTLEADRITLGADTANSVPSLIVEEGGMLMATQLSLGNDSSSALFVVDNAIANLSGNLLVGFSGVGEVVVADGGELAVDGTTVIADGASIELTGFSTLHSDLDCSGTLITSGNNAQINGNLMLENSGVAEIDSLDVTGDYYNFGDGSNIVDALGVVEIGGTYRGSARFAGNGTIRFGGEVRPGDFANPLAFVDFGENTLEFESGSSVTFQLLGSGDLEHDRIMTTGQVDIASGVSLAANPLFGFQVNNGDTITLIDRGPGSTGQFDGLPEGANISLQNGVQLTISYIGGPDQADVVLTASTTLFGDVNLDGSVDLLDINPFVERISSGPYQPEADCNQDGAVDLLDVNPFVLILNGN